MKNIESVLSVIKDMLFIIVGTFLVSFAIKVFLLPNELSTGGFSGIATILYYICKLRVGLTIIILNIPLFILALRYVGKEFTFKSIIATMLLSVFLEIFDYSSIINTKMDLLICSIFGGIITGIGLSLVFKAGASTGGSDLLANILTKLYKSTNISKLLLVIETVIILLMIIFLKNLNAGLYSIIALLVSSKVIDFVFEGINRQCEITIITNKKDEILNEILYNMDRGATVINSVGAHSKIPNYTITCIVNRNEVNKMKKNILKIDKSCILYVTIVNEIIGNGFKLIDI